MEGISKETLQRLPTYLRLLKEMRQQGIMTVSSTTIADRLRLNPVQVRKDFAGVSSSAGKPKTGFETEELINDISDFLGYNDASQAIIVGAGKLGKALIGYSNFKSYGLEIIAAFDNNADKIPNDTHSIPIYAIEELPDFVKKTGVHIGIITVPKDEARKVCELLVTSGIRAIWNFAPVHLTVPDTVAIKNEDMAASLAVLSKRLSELLLED